LDKGHEIIALFGQIGLVDLGRSNVATIACIDYTGNGPFGRDVAMLALKRRAPLYYDEHSDKRKEHSAEGHPFLPRGGKRITCVVNAVQKD